MEHFTFKMSGYNLDEKGRVVDQGFASGTLADYTNAMSYAFRQCPEMLRFKHVSLHLYPI